MAIRWRVIFASVAVWVVHSVSGTYALPTFGSDCASCHDRSAGSFNVMPNLLELFPGEMGEVTFDVTQLGTAGQDAALAVFGLDAADLMATPDLTGWTSQSGGTFLSSNLFNTARQVALNLSIGAGAIPGDFPINVTLAGGPSSDWSTTGSFTIRVVPEPVTVALLGLALVSLGTVARKRLRRQATGTYRIGRCRFK